MTHSHTVLPLGSQEERPKEFRRAINQLINGNISGSVTLTANATTTTVTHENISTERHPVLTAAAGTWSSLSLRVSSITQGSFVITHSNEAATDRVVHWHL